MEKAKAFRPLDASVFPHPKTLSITFANLLKTCRKRHAPHSPQIDTFNLYAGSFSGMRRTSPRETAHPGARHAAEVIDRL